MVTVFSREGCSNCVKVKDWLIQAGLMFNVVDIDLDTNAMQEVRRSGLRSLPVIKYGDNQFTSGFDKKELEHIAAISE